MRKLIVWNLMTLDGYFEGTKKWDLNWHSLVLGDEFDKYAIDQLKSSDLLIFGRETYQGMADYWTTTEDEGEVTDLMNSTPKMVISTTLDKATWNNTKLIKTNVIDELSKIKQKPGKDILIMGSANLISNLMNTDLIDEYRLLIVPVVLGAGKPLFKKNKKMKKMNLINTKQMKSGGIILTYEPDRSQ